MPVTRESIAERQAILIPIAGALYIAARDEDPTIPEPPAWLCMQTALRTMWSYERQGSSPSPVNRYHEFMYTQYPPGMDDAYRSESRKYLGFAGLYLWSAEQAGWTELPPLPRAPVMWVSGHPHNE